MSKNADQEVTGVLTCFKSLKKFEIIIESNLPGHLNNIYSAFSGKLAYLFKFQLSRNIVNIFSKSEILEFRNVQKLRIEMPTFHITFGQEGLISFVKSLENLEEFHISSLCDQFIYAVDNMGDRFEQLMVQNENPDNNAGPYLKNFLSLNKDQTFGYQILDFGFEQIAGLADKLTKLELVLDTDTTGGLMLTGERDIADPKVPIFPNCSELRLEVYILVPLLMNESLNFAFPSIVQKFPRLEKFTIVSCEQFSPTENGLQLKSFCDAQVICFEQCDFNLFQNYEEMKEVKAHLVLEVIDDGELEFHLASETEGQLSQEIFDKDFFAIQTEISLGTVMPGSLQVFQQQQPKITNEDLQLIIQHYPNLKELYLDNCSNLSDLGLTGLTEQAIQDRVEDPSLSIQPHEISGRPISNLQNLEKLVIKDSISQSPSQQRISNISANLAFENMIHLKYLDLGLNQITPEGFETIQRKSGSQKLTILN